MEIIGGFRRNRHPTPTDFFRIMRDVSGMDLDWFWRAWIFEAARLDQAIVDVSASETGQTTVFIENRAAMVMPTELLIEFADHTREVVAVTIDPRSVYPDDDRTNNVWAQ